MNRGARRDDACYSLQLQERILLLEYGGTHAPDNVPSFGEEARRQQENARGNTMQ